MTPRVIKQPVITERTLQLANQSNIYTFEVDRLSNKNQIKAEVEALYGVDVKAVNTVTQRRIAKTTGKKRLRTVVAPYKKALVTVKAGQTISVFDLGGAA
jgi:large subunit ribosomal protein L23